MDKLVLLQKERHITIMPTDKTGGVAVFNTDDYIKGMESLLHTKFIDSNGIDHPFFNHSMPWRQTRCNSMTLKSLNLM